MIWELRDEELTGFMWDTRPWGMRCVVRNCYFASFHATKEEAKWARADHKHLWAGEEWMMAQGMTFIQETWARMMYLIEQVHTESDLDQKQNLRCEIRGMATVITHWMPPQFDTAMSIMVELKRRYDCKIAGEEVFTPGIEAPWRPASIGGPPSQSAPAQVSLIGIDDDTRETVNGLLMMKMMTPEQIASVYSITEAQVHEIGKLYEHGV